MEGDGSLESRLRYIEQGSQQLKQQMQVMKQLVTTEVDELRGVLKLQVEDMKNIIIQQDNLYTERIRRLEARVEQLAEFSLHLAQSKGLVGSLARDGQPPAGGAAFAAESPQLGAAGGRGGDLDAHIGNHAPLGPAHDSDDEGQEKAGHQAVLAKYQEKIRQVYRHYTETASRALHPVMTLHQFTKFTKDCGLCNSSQGGTVAVNAYLPPPELLWMNCLRRLPGRRQGKKKVVTGNFAHERVQEVTAELFPDVLVILAEEQYGRGRQDMDRGQVVELFLTRDVFPATDHKILQATTQRTMARDKRTTPRAASSINDYVDNEEVKDLLAEYKTRIANTFSMYISKSNAQYRRAGGGLPLQGFSDVVKDHGLLPLISKSDVREIFLNVIHTADVMRSAAGQAPQAQGKNPDALELDKKGFFMALRHLAEHVYGERAMAEKYQTPEARLKKLLSKMYLLAGH
eukprot:TRINITY_DN20254_c0_g1_i1.p1 TRINITY_DN20254_c0_g1~~TRINITY_DN20254_c0_g1_i1.p1  ORF type:complete len:459 (+),score=214.18 TRINITY_DN20254_c0_g1_i1:66-1442(+)